MFRGSLLAQTGQLWKLVVGLLVAAAGFGIMFYGLQTRLTSFRLSGAAIALCAFAGICLAVRCPSCGRRWVWNAVRTQEHLQWVNALRTQRTCEGCGFPDASGHRENRL
jgi:cytochrome b subunit of formate dehydrogenase